MGREGGGGQKFLVSGIKLIKDKLKIRNKHEKLFNRKIDPNLVYFLLKKCFVVISDPPRVRPFLEVILRSVARRNLNRIADSSIFETSLSIFEG